MAAKVDPPFLPRFLYRYRPIDDATLDQEIATIVNPHLWFSTYRKLNDPMEGFYAATRRVQDHDEYEGIARDILNEKRSIGICCFSDTKNSELTWVHYARNYAGICIGYRPIKLMASLTDETHAVRLSYGSRPPEIGIGEITDVSLAAQKVLSHKKDSWSYEREWRLLGSPGRVKITSECLGEICFGFRMSTSYRAKLKKAMAHLDISVRDMRVDGYAHKFTNTPDV